MVCLSDQICLIIGEFAEDFVYISRHNTPYFFLCKYDRDKIAAIEERLRQSSFTGPCLIGVKLIL